jgi:hypothetical protein
MPKPLFKIIAGGQTGADRAALEWAITHKIPHAGWCPKDRKAEDGPIPRRFRLRETRSNTFAARTRWNVRDSDGTVIFSASRAITGGTALTRDWARRLGKPVLHLTQRLRAAEAARRLDRFLVRYSIQRLNVAGPRASQEPAIGDFARAVLDRSQVLAAR